MTTTRSRKVERTIAEPFQSQIQEIPTDRLIPYVNNVKQHPPEQIEKLISSIAEFGFTVPILVDRDYVVIAGHGRLAAAKKMELRSVPVIVRDDLTPAQVKAYRIADNKLAESSWDDEALRVELEALAELDFDLTLTGWDAVDLTAFEPDTEFQGGETIGQPSDSEWGEAFDRLPEGDRQPFQQMTFTLHDSQADRVKEALAAAKEMGEFVDSPNENSNGNALDRICDFFLNYANR